MSEALPALPFYWPDAWVAPIFASKQEAVDVMRDEASRIVCSQIALIAASGGKAPDHRQVKAAVAIWRAAAIVEKMIERERVMGGVR
jgi:hypothetical protein